MAWTCQSHEAMLAMNPSEQEGALLRELVLDDYYCGRDLVN